MSPSRITKFTNGFLLKDGQLVEGDLWISSETGCIISPQSAFYSAHLTPDHIIDLKGRILCPGLMDVQLNGGYNFDFSVPDANYAENLRDTNRRLIQGGVTSYLPTVTSQLPKVYHSVLPHLGQSKSRDPTDGAQSLGAHVEGPFLSPAKNGIHTKEVLREAETWNDIEECYGRENLKNVRKITAAPERGNMLSLIPDIVSHDVIYSIGHSDATLEEAETALQAGARMVTHMFNAMRPFGHRDPGIFGLLGQSRPSSPLSSSPVSRTNSPAWSPIRVPATSSNTSRRSSPRSSLSMATSAADLDKPEPLAQPYFGLISDGIHLSPQALKIAYSAHPSGAILVTDAMKLSGMPDGVYEWTNGERIIKSGAVLTLEKNGRIAGSAVTLIECINNFRNFTGASIAECLQCVTETPAKMLMETKKGTLDVGRDADLVVLDDVDGELKIEQVWKFGVQVV